MRAISLVIPSVTPVTFAGILDILILCNYKVHLSCSVDRRSSCANGEARALEEDGG